MAKTAASGLEYATTLDLARAVETDGTPTNPVTVMASHAFNVSYDKVTPEQRNLIKSWRHAQAYGMSGRTFVEAMRRSR